MFVTSSNYEQNLRAVINENGNELLLAVAFWGRGAEVIIPPTPGRNIKLICNLQSGATNPETIELLRNREDVTVKQHPRLHAKVIVGTNSALVGSANFSSNGINLEGNELHGWEEAGIVVTENLEAIRNWFQNLWNDAEEVTDEHLIQARERWNIRRRTRIISSIRTNRFSLQEITPSDLADRPAFLAIYRKFLSKAAENAYARGLEEFAGQRAVDVDNQRMTAFEDWTNIPVPENNEAPLIDIYYGPRGAVECHGIFTYTFNIDFGHDDGTPGHLAVCSENDRFYGYTFGGREAQALREAIRPYIADIWNNAAGDDGGRIISLEQVLQIINNG